MRLLPLGLMVGVALAVAGCGDDDATTVPAETTTTIAPTTSAASTIPPTSIEPPSVTTIAPTTSAAPVGDQACRVLDDPSEDAGSEWVVVNDGVMGGRSQGQLTLVEDALVFDGEIVTAGGGFSSIRTDLATGALDDADRVIVQARTDGRSYLLTFDDAAPERDRRTSFQAPIPFGAEAGVEQVEVRLDDLVPVVFGQQVDDDPFVPELATEIGIQLSDGVDGAFRLELDALLVCAG